MLNLNLDAVQKAKKFLKEIDIIIHVAGGGYGIKNSLIKSPDLNTLYSNQSDEIKNCHTGQSIEKIKINDNNLYQSA